jgi:hypothetical protein
MKKELTLEDFSIKNGEEYQEFLGIGRRKKGGLPPSVIAPIPSPFGNILQSIKPKTQSDAKMEAMCKGLFKKTKKCRDYFEQKLRKEQESARLVAEAAAKEAAQQTTLIKTITQAISKASTEAQAQQARQNLELARELAELRTNQASLAKERADQLGVIQQDLKQTSGTNGGEISNNQADLINKILNESTLDKMKQAVTESPLLAKLPNKLQAEMTAVSEAIPSESDLAELNRERQVRQEMEAKVESGSTSSSTGAAPAAADKKNNMLLYGAIGVGVLLLLFGKKIFGGKAAAAAPTA